MRDTVSPSNNVCGSCIVLIVNENDKQLKMFNYYIEHVVQKNVVLYSREASGS